MDTAHRSAIELRVIDIDDGGGRPAIIGSETYFCNDLV
jgi:hypothetical protein